MTLVGVTSDVLKGLSYLFPLYGELTASIVDVSAKQRDGLISNQTLKHFPQQRCSAIRYLQSFTNLRILKETK